MRPTRSLLFVPGHRKGWADKAVAAGADAVILDLEDSVPVDMKAETRHMVAETIRDLAKQPSRRRRLRAAQRVGNRHDGRRSGGRRDRGLRWLPAAQDLWRARRRQPRRLSTISSAATASRLESWSSSSRLETAQAYADCENMISASPRCATLFAGTARDADVSRSVGFEFTPRGTRDDLPAQPRGAGHPGGGQGLPDRRPVAGSQGHRRSLGVRAPKQAARLPRHGRDPSQHVAIANEVFTPSASDVAFYQGMIDAFEAAVEKGLAAIDYEGMHIDYAHVKTAKEVIALHRGR